MMYQVDTTLTMVVIALASACFTALATVIGAIVSTTAWLKDQFAQTSISLKGLLDSHEHMDQKRHVDNIERFAKIETQLNVVIKNGH